MTLSCNTELSMPSEQAVRYTNDLFTAKGSRRLGLMEWPALLRRLDKLDPSYAS